MCVAVGDCTLAYDWGTVSRTERDNTTTFLPVSQSVRHSTCRTLSVACVESIYIIASIRNGREMKATLPSNIATRQFSMHKCLNNIENTSSSSSSPSSSSSSSSSIRWAVQPVGGREPPWRHAACHMTTIIDRPVWPLQGLYSLADNDLEIIDRQRISLCEVPLASSVGTKVPPCSGGSLTTFVFNVFAATHSVYENDSFDEQSSGRTTGWRR